MSEKLCQEPAFATSADLCGEAVYQEGMSKRFYAACAAMQGMLANPDTCNWAKSEECVIESAYRHADALLHLENQ